MEADRRVHPYSTYQEYIAMQRAKSLRTRRQTTRYGWHRTIIAERLKELCPTAKTMLCLGARNDVEVLDFAEKGFEVQGIDLFSSQHIVKCDMARIDRHPHFAGKTFDIFVAIHAIEHCLDFDGFVRCLTMCNQALACVTPQIDTPNSWDCSAFNFARPGAALGEIERVFPGFQLGWSDVVRRTLRFLVLREGLPK